MAKVRPLHMAKSLEELNKKITHDKMKQAAPKLLCKTAEKIFLKARDAKLQDRDEEQAYVLFMRFLDVVSCIRKSREYKSSKREFDKLLPTARFTQALDEAEELAKHLEERYVELSKPVDKKPRFEDDLNTDHVVPSSPGKPLSAQQLYKQSKPLVPQQASTLGDLDEGWFGNQSSTSLLDTLKASTSSFPTLSPQQLYEHLQNNPEDVLVLDCRPRAEYNASHVDNKRFPQWLCVPEEIVKKGFSSENVLSFLPPAGKKHWKERDRKQWVVLVDDDSTAEALTGSLNNVAILSLKDALHKWDTTVKQEPFVLEGGYAMWYLTYSPLCTGVYKKKEGNRTEGEVSVQKQQPVSVDYPSLPSVSESAVQDEELTSEKEGAAKIGPLLDQAATYQGSDSQDGRLDSMKQTDSSGGQEGVIQSPPEPTPSAPPLEQVSTLVPTIQIPSTYAPLPPPPSAIPVALTLEGESALLTPTLSTDDILPDIPELDPGLPSSFAPPMQHGHSSHPVVPITTDSMLPHSQQHNVQLQYPVVANSHHVPQTYRNQVPTYPPEATEAHPPPLSVGHHQLVPQQQIPGGISALANHAAQGMLNGTHYQTDHGTYLSHPNEYTAQTPQGQDPHHFTAQYPHNPSGGGAISAPPPQVIQPHPQHVQTYIVQPHPQHVHSQVAQPHPQHGHSQVVQPHPQHGHSQVVQPYPQQVHSQVVQPYTQQVHAPPPQVAQPHPQHVQTQVAQPHPQHVHSQLTQPHLQQVHAQPPQVPQPYPQHLQAQVTQPHPSGLPTQSPPQSWVQQPVSAPTATSVQIPPHQLAPMPTQPTQNLPNLTPNHRVVNGPIPNPPSYDDSQQLPPCPPVQPPIPPPVSITQPNQFAQQNGSQEHATTATQEHAMSDSDLLVKEARIQELERRLAEKNKETHSEREQTEKAIEDFKQQQEREKRALQEQLESEKRKLEEVKYRDSELKREREALQLQLQQEKAQHAQELERERQVLAQTREQFQREIAEQQQQMLQLKSQFEREKILVQQQQKEMLQHLQLRKQQENERMFTVSQGMPAGWEKRLDPGTGRFYYMDHNTKTTHWNPPTNWLAYQAEMQKQKEMQEQQRQMIHPLPGGERYLQPKAQIPGAPQTPPGQVPPGMSAVAPIPRQQPPTSTPHPSLQPQQVVPPLSSRQTAPVQPPPRQVGAPQQPIPTSTPQRISTPPSIPQQQRTSTKTATPVVDRSTKPASVPSQHPASMPTVDRSKKPIMSASMYKKKIENLQPVYGSHGYVLTGLRNLGNTCFMNCTLQCLNCTTPMIEYFITGKFRNDINHTNPLGRGGEVAEEFSFLVKAMWSGQYRSVSPRDFKHTICKLAPQFEGTAQQDSQELLAFLMDGLHEDLNRVKHKEVIETRSNRGVPDAQIARQSWEDHRKRNDSIIIDWFQGQFRSTVMCLQCKHRSVTFEAFMYLSLPIPPGTRRYTLQLQGFPIDSNTFVPELALTCVVVMRQRVTIEAFMYLSLPIPPGTRQYTLQDCIQLFTKQEKIDSWVCLNCKRQDAVKKIEIWKLPRILIIILNRFRFEGVWREKRQNYIDFPLSSLDMTSNVVGVRPPGQYNLYAVSNHYGGTMSGGHYTAFCMNPYKRKFYCFDDHEVKDIRDVRDIRSNGAYVLFYTATDFTPPRML